MGTNYLDDSPIQDRTKSFSYSVNNNQFDVLNDIFHENIAENEIESKEKQFNDQANQSNIEIAQINSILKKLYESKAKCETFEQNLMQKFENLISKQNFLESSLQKIKKLKKAKQKKHVKYISYLPLSKIYYYSSKSTNYYFILLDIIINSKRKDKENKQIVPLTSGLQHKQPNRLDFSAIEDQILLTNLKYSRNWFEIAKEINRTPLECCIRSLELSSFYTYRKWTLKEDSILKKAILYYGPKNWQQISYCLDGRNNSQSFHRWMKGINPMIKRDKWSFEEDLTLGVALKIYGNKKWSKIARHLKGRTDIQCRERFCNILDPSLEEVEWTTKEDIKLMTLYEKFGNKWSKIAKEFGNRTDNTCWRRWKYLTNFYTAKEKSGSINAFERSFSGFSGVEGQHPDDYSAPSNSPTIPTKVNVIYFKISKDNDRLTKRKSDKLNYNYNKDGISGNAIEVNVNVNVNDNDVDKTFLSENNTQYSKKGIKKKIFEINKRKQKDYL